MKETIKYSVSMRSNPVKPDDAPKAYATLQTNGTINLDDLSKHIHDNGSVFTEGTILGVLQDMCHCIRAAIIEGSNVELAELGTFRLGINSTGAESMSKFNAASNIKGLNVNFEPGTGLSWDLDDDVNFERVTSRKAQAAAKAAQLAGNTSADWSDTESGDTESGDDSNEEVEESEP